MKKHYFFLLFLGYSFSAIANPFQRISFDLFEAKPYLSEMFLSKNLYNLDAETLIKTANIYRTYPRFNENLALFAEGRAAYLQKNYHVAISHYHQILRNNQRLHPVRLELAITLFQQKENNASKREFEHLQQYDLPLYEQTLISDYLKAIKFNESWNVDFSVNYIREKNINQVADTENIHLSSRATLKKSGGLLPQNGHGLAYYFSAKKDTNIVGSNYFLLGNHIGGKLYWDNHVYDDMSYRIFSGYAYKTAKNTLQIKPFYEKRWYGNESYRWGQGINFDYSLELSPNWQILSTFEWAKQRYFEDEQLNGHNMHLSSTLFWQVNNKQFFYWGVGYFSERTRVKQYSSDSKILRLGWGQEWWWNLRTQVNASLIKKSYKDIAALGNLSVFSFGKIRQDNIYSLNALLWKNDLHYFGILPKIQFIWRNQKSNIPQMYSYQDKSVNVLFEKAF